MFVATLVLTAMGLNRKLPTIKALRIHTGCGLKYAKDLFELAEKEQHGAALLVSDDVGKPSGVAPLIDADGRLLGHVSWIDLDSTAIPVPPTPATTVEAPKPKFVRHLMILPGDGGPSLVNPNNIVSARPSNGGAVVECNDDYYDRVYVIHTTATTADIVALLEE